MNALVRFDNVSLGYDGRPALRHLKGEIPAGELLAIVGPNGAGKSTLMKALAGRLRVLEGSMSFAGLHRRDIAYLPQAADVDRSFPLSIFDLVSAGTWRSSGLFGGFGKSKSVLVHDALATVGLAGFGNRAIGALSGGQLQRALFARLLVQDAKLILLDEPFAAIDSGTTADLLGLIRRWHGEQRTIIAVLHDMDLVRKHFPQTLLIARETIAWGDSATVLCRENLAMARSKLEPDRHLA